MRDGCDFAPLCSTVETLDTFDHNQGWQRLLYSRTSPDARHDSVRLLIWDRNVGVQFSPCLQMLALKIPKGPSFSASILSSSVLCRKISIEVSSLSHFGVVLQSRVGSHPHDISLSWILPEQCSVWLRQCSYMQGTIWNCLVFVYTTDFSFFVIINECESTKVHFAEFPISCPERRSTST
jgi:hypothetical protein